MVEYICRLAHSCSRITVMNWAENSNHSFLQPFRAHWTFLNLTFFIVTVKPDCKFIVFSVKCTMLWRCAEKDQGAEEGCKFISPHLQRHTQSFKTSHFVEPRTQTTNWRRLLHAPLTAQSPRVNVSHLSFFVGHYNVVKKITSTPDTCSRIS